MKSKILEMVSPTSALFSVLLIIIGSIGPIIMALIVSNSPRVEAEIIGFEKYTTTNQEEAFRPQFKFMFEGKEYIETSIIESQQKAYRPGDQIKVFLISSNPGKAEIYNPKVLYIPFLITFALGIILAFVYKKIKKVEQKSKPEFEHSVSESIT